MYQFGASRNIFHHFLTSYICTQIKINHHIIVFFSYLNNSILINKLIHIILVKNWRYKDVMVLEMVYTYCWYYHIVKEFVGLILYPVVEWRHIHLERWRNDQKTTWHGLFLCFGSNYFFMKLFDGLLKTRTYLLIVINTIVMSISF